MSESTPSTDGTTASGTAPARRRTPLVALMIAQYLSAFGNAITIVTVPMYVLSSTGSSMATGLAGFANTLPLIFAGAVGGVLIDRFGGRRLSVLCDLTAGVVIALVPVLDETTGMPLPVLMALLFGRTVVATPAGAARMTLLQPLTERAGARLAGVNSWYQASPRLGLVVGAPLAGLLVAVSDPLVGMYVDAATFLLAAAIIAFLVPGAKRRSEAPQGRRPGFFTQLAEGAALIRTMPVIGAMTAFVVVTNFLDDAFTPLFLPVYAQTVLHEGATLGWLLAASGIGSIIGTLLYGPASRRLLANRRWTLLGCFAVVAALRLLLVLQPNLVGTVAICFLIGLAGGPLNPMLSTVMLERVPEELRGRVFGLSGALAMGAAPLGILCAGLAVDWTGLRTAMLSFALAYVVLIVVSLRVAALKNMDARPASDDKEMKQVSAA
ncbi:MFS transporter [Streptomyces lavendofoliae]|uniref:MFS transporter n=1 Tax=Streptomyces lavendofoliae TaxID=67314 RepID=UPI003D93BB47